MPARRWSERLGRKLVEGVAEHGSVNRAAQALGVARGWRTVWEWQRKGHMVDGVPLQDAIEEARREHATALQDDLQQVMQELQAASLEDDPSSSRVSALGRRMQGLQWQLSKLLPRLYGDKVEHTGQVEHGLTVQVVSYASDTATPALEDDPRAPVPAGRALPALEGEVLTKQ